MSTETEIPFENIPEIALAWHKNGKGAILATVVETWGSAPRRVGGQLVVNREGEMHGSVSGGCVEAAVVFEAIDALETGECRLLEYGVSDADAFAAGLACGGRICVFLEPIGSILPVELLEQLLDCRAQRCPVAYCVNINSGKSTLAFSGHETRMLMDTSGLEEDRETFIAVYNPPVRMVVVGAVHIAQALIPMARLTGFDPVLIDPRESFASEERFPGEKIIIEWPSDALEKLGNDRRTGLVLLTHDPKIDDPALEFALSSDYFYVGALGSKKTHAQRISRLEKKGYSDNQMSRIHGPVGLAIGSATPAEIALSILCEMVKCLRRTR